MDNNFFFYDNRRRAFAFCRIRRPKIAGKTGPRFFWLKNSFSIHFRPKTLRKHLEHLDKPIYGLKKQKKAQKTEVNPNLKTFPRSNLSLREMRKKKTPR